MTGFIRVSVEKEDGAQHIFKVETALKEVGISEKCAIVDAVLRGLNVDSNVELACILGNIVLKREKKEKEV